MFSLRLEGSLRPDVRPGNKEHNQTFLVDGSIAGMILSATGAQNVASSVTGTADEISLDMYWTEVG
jgi:hypothetical protein